MGFSCKFPPNQSIEYVVGIKSSKVIFGCLLVAKKAPKSWPSLCLGMVWLAWAYYNLVGGFNLPLWKIWVRQLGLRNSQYMESHKNHVPNHQTAIIASPWTPALQDPAVPWNWFWFFWFLAPATTSLSVCQTPSQSTRSRLSAGSPRNGAWPPKTPVLRPHRPCRL